MPNLKAEKLPLLICPSVLSKEASANHTLSPNSPRRVRVSDGCHWVPRVKISSTISEANHLGRNSALPAPCSHLGGGCAMLQAPGWDL